MTVCVVERLVDYSECPLCGSEKLECVSEFDRRGPVPLQEDYWQCRGCDYRWREVGEAEGVSLRGTNSVIKKFRDQED